jgi:hypothetical protein
MVRFEFGNTCFHHLSAFAAPTAPTVPTYARRFRCAEGAQIGPRPSRGRAPSSLTGSRLAPLGSFQLATARQRDRIVETPLPSCFWASSPLAVFVDLNLETLGHPWRGTVICGIALRARCPSAAAVHRCSPSQGRIGCFSIPPEAQPPAAGVSWSAAEAVTRTGRGLRSAPQTCEHRPRRASQRPCHQ